MGNNEPAVDQSDLRIRGSYGLNIYVHILLHQARSTLYQNQLKCHPTVTCP